MLHVFINMKVVVATLLATLGCLYSEATLSFAAEDDILPYPSNLITPRSLNLVDSTTTVTGEWSVPCSEQYEEHSERSAADIGKCLPKDCKRVVIDGFVSEQEVKKTGWHC